MALLECVFVRAADSVRELIDTASSDSVAKQIDTLMKKHNAKTACLAGGQTIKLNQILRVE